MRNNWQPAAIIKVKLVKRTPVKWPLAY